MNAVVTRGYLTTLGLVVTSGYVVAQVAPSTGIRPDLELSLRIFRSLHQTAAISRTAQLDSEMPRRITFDTELS